MMQQIGHELHRNTGCFTFASSKQDHPRVLDMCAAPGGFLATALGIEPRAHVTGFSLPEESGGHEILLPTSPSIAIKYADITMFAADMGLSSIPATHDANDFYPRQLHDDKLFDIALCDGQVRRQHVRAEYGQAREARRLGAVQLAIGLQHMRPGGTMIILLHKIEAFEVVALLQKFDQFSEVHVYKPTVAHAIRSSFYLVAKNVEPEHHVAIAMLRELKSVWHVATFGTDQEYERVTRKEDDVVDEVLELFGSRLIELAGPIWSTQKAALEQASFIKDSQR